MARKIQFRAWDKGQAPFEEPWEKTRMIYAVETLYDGSIEGLGAYGSFGNILGDHDRFVVEQFIGVCDKNGREIYEGDILRTRFIETSDVPVVVRGIPVETGGGVFDYFGSVVFAGGAFRFLSKEYNSWDDLKKVLLNEEGKITSDDEVVGNIHEHPELLK